MNLFKKAAVFTDLHLGLKSNSLAHNQDCADFVDWFIGVAQQQGCETGIFCGDWHHHRASLNLQTLSIGMQAMERLSAAFDQFFVIPGNHDLYYKDSRSIFSTEWARYLPNIQVLNEWTKTGDVLFVPWLVKDEHKKIANASAQYMFGHFELPHFKMNAMVEMPDHGEVKHEHFGGVGQVFSGHFHLRQQKHNINYIGNAFPHNFADAGDSARGMMTLEWGQEPEYHAWPDQPLYTVVGLAELIDRAADLLKPKMHVRVALDIDISYEEANYIKETFVKQYQLREMSLIPNKSAEVGEDLAPTDVHFESVDQIVIDQITNIDSEFYDPRLLLQIYQNL